MEGISHRMVKVNGIDMHIAEKGQGPVVLLLHGFPELWPRSCGAIAPWISRAVVLLAPSDSCIKLPWIPCCRTRS